VSDLIIAHEWSQLLGVRDILLLSFVGVSEVGGSRHQRWMGGGARAWLVVHWVLVWFVA
jgi:hypothetical protein